MHQMRPLGTSFALALTAGIIYPLCALAFFLWPSGALAFFSAVFHGIDLTSMRASGAALSVWQIIYGFCGTVLIAFVVGLVYAWMNNLVRGLFFRTRVP